MPKFEVIGQVYLADGVDWVIDATDCQDAERKAKRLAECRVWTEPTIHEVCIESCTQIADSEETPATITGGLRIPHLFDRVRLLIAGSGHVYNARGGEDYVEVPAGEIWTVTSIDYFAPPQRLSFTIEHKPTGVVNVIDEGDLIDWCYPFELVADSD